MSYTVKYYNVKEDLEEYPEAWLYIAWSKRGAGKTYGALLTALEQNIKIVYIKRTMDDVNLICSGDMGADFSPYKPINRDTDYNIKPKLLRPGIGAFYHTNSDGDPDGLPVAYCLALSGVRKYKGFDLSDCDWIVFDEFIPQLGERINRNEGEQLLDLYMTIQRDRTLRNRPDLKLILFANAVDISSPVTNLLNVSDDMAEMVQNGAEYEFNTERGILLHFLPPQKYASGGEESLIEKSMKNTRWGAMAFSGEFAFNDFSNVEKLRSKNMQPLLSLHYNLNDYYIYVNRMQGIFYMTSKRYGNFDLHYDLDTDNGYRKFHLDYLYILQDKTINGIMRYERYSMYDLIMNYKKYFKV